MFTERLHVLFGGPLRSASEKDSRDRAGEHEVSDLCDDGYGSKSGVHVGTEDTLFLAAFDCRSESFEKARGQGANRRFGVGGFPVDELPGQQDREVGISGEDRNLTLDYGPYYVFRAGLWRDSTSSFRGDAPNNSF